MMDRRQLLLVAVLSITSCVYAHQGQHTVFAMVLGKGGQKMPEIKVNGVKMNLRNPVNQAPNESGALVQGPPSDTKTFIVGGKASDNSLGKLPVMAEALVMPATSKPKTAEDKAMDDLKLTEEEKKKLFPCEDYKPYCKNYAQTGQCRDVYTQRYCRKSCDLCKVPYGVFIGCQDLDVCKKFAASACMVHWVRETCKSKCGVCGYERQGNAHITIGKKRHFSDTNVKKQDKSTHDVKKIEKKQKDKVKQLQKVLTKVTKKVKDAVKQVAAKVEKLKKKNDKPSVNNKPVVKPTVSVSEKSDDHGDVNEKNDSAVDDDTADQDVSGEGSSDDEDEDDNDDEDEDNESSAAEPEDEPEEPIKLDTDPRGEPVVAKMVHQPIKFNDAPLKAVRVKLVKSKKQVKAVKDAKPKVEHKKTAKKVSNDKVEKKAKTIDEVVKQDKPKIKTTKPKKLKN